MTTLGAGDYFELSHGRELPAGLASDPPRYQACALSLQAAIGRKAAAGRAKTPPSVTVLLTKCQQLYRALKAQAAAYLVNGAWSMQLYEKNGITVSDAEVQKLYRKVQTKEYPTKAKRERFLRLNRRTLADELYVIKLDLFYSKMEERLKTGAKALFAKLTEEGQKLTTKTTCQPGYVVQHCRQFSQTTPVPSPSAAVLMEQIATSTGTKCVNLAACAKQ